MKQSIVSLSYPSSPKKPSSTSSCGPSVLSFARLALRALSPLPASSLARSPSSTCPGFLDLPFGSISSFSLPSLPHLLSIAGLFGQATATFPLSPLLSLSLRPFLPLFRRFRRCLPLRRPNGLLSTATRPAGGSGISCSRWEMDRSNGMGLGTSASIVWCINLKNRVNCR